MTSTPSLRSARVALALTVALLSRAASAQAAGMVHTPGMSHDSAMAARLPTAPGQDAYAAIAEVVRLLDADPSTDWSRVNLEALRQHLVDMNEVTLRAAVAQFPAPGGVALRVTGTGRTLAAIRAMVRSHASALAAMPAYAARVDDLADGVRFTVTARDTSDARAVQRIRGLGFAGLMTIGDHHAAHHLALARGAAGEAHTH
jgi:hypothetical protein